MKLILCPLCSDVVKLDTALRECKCGKSRGRYLEDGRHATYGGRAVPLAVDNHDLARAVRKKNHPPSNPTGHIVFLYVVPPDAPRFKKEGRKP